MYIIKILLSLLPVFLFLLALIFLDSYKLVKLRSIVQTILIGCVVAVASFVLNNRLLHQFSFEHSFYSRYAAPVIEESLKAIYLFYLMRSKKIGFMVDAAIHGFAIGAGFALVENVYYLQNLPNPNLLLWIIRGFGTAIMHGGVTAIVGILSKSLSDRHASEGVLIFVPGLAIAIGIHSFFNHFLLSPLISTAMLLIALPLLIVIVFAQSEKSTRNWLGIGFDSDVELLEMINTGNLPETRIGSYLYSLKSRFPGEMVADMLCLLRIHVELSMRAKGVLLMRGVGFRIAPAPEIQEQFDELSYLEKSIGKTGLLAIAPFLHKSSRDLWQLYMLGKK
jgi:RsiW-degrading membrane proteinase PrsW (M82 family)